MEKHKLGNALAKIVGRQNVLYEEDELLTYECDGLTLDKVLPDAVVFPTSTAQVAKIVKWQMSKVSLLSPGEEERI